MKIFRNFYGNMSIKLQRASRFARLSSAVTKTLLLTYILMSLILDGLAQNFEANSDSLQSNEKTNDAVFLRVANKLKSNSWVKERFGPPILSVTKNNGPQKQKFLPNGNGIGSYTCDVIGSVTNGTIVATWDYSPIGGANVYLVHITNLPPHALDISGPAASAPVPDVYYSKTNTDGVEIFVSIKKRNGPAVESIYVKLKNLKSLKVDNEIKTNFPSGTTASIQSPGGTWIENPINHQVTLTLTNALTWGVGTNSPFFSHSISIPMP